MTTVAEIELEQLKVLLEIKKCEARLFEIIIEEMNMKDTSSFIRNTVQSEMMYSSVTRKADVELYPCWWTGGSIPCYLTPCEMVDAPTGQAWRLQ